MAELGEVNVLGLINRTLFITGRVVYPPRDEVISSLVVPIGNVDANHHMRSMIKSTWNLAIQKFRSLANWVFHSVHDVVDGSIWQAAAWVSWARRFPKG